MPSLYPSFLDLFFPPRCLHCRAYVSGSTLCGQCAGTLNIERTFFCGACGGRIPRGEPGCHPRSYALGAALRYETPAARSLVLALKFHNSRAAGRELGRLAYEYLASMDFGWNEEPAAIAPIPLGFWRRRKRGFNQAEIIGREIAARTGIPLRTDILRRVRETAPQSNAPDKEARRKNLEGAFIASGGNLEGLRTIYLVDDVRTSGATLGAAAAAIKAVAEVRVLGLVAAHT